jgi:hypothetical protein
MIARLYDPGVIEVRQMSKKVAHFLLDILRKTERQWWAMKAD